MTKPVIGFIGLGLMGGNMVECLQKNAFKPIVIDLNKDLGTRSLIAEGSSSNLQAAFDAGMGNGNVPEIFDYFLKLDK